jgi:molybdate transport system regulatory protein
VPVEASLTFRREDRPAIGRERIRILEAVAREGSITAAAKAVGLTYKATWDALDAMTNLFGRPLLETRHGGPAGGGARLTEAGRRLITSFSRLESELERVLRSLEPELAGIGLAPVEVLTGFLMRTSCRNVLRGTIIAITGDALSTDISIQVGAGPVIQALITRDSMASLGLCPGREVVALIKSSFVMLADPAVALRLSTRNRVAGTVSRCAIEGVSAEIVLDVGGGLSLTAAITADAVRELGLAPGAAATAVFDPSHVILAVD